MVGEDEAALVPDVQLVPVLCDRIAPRQTPVAQLETKGEGFGGEW